MEDPLPAQTDGPRPSLLRKPTTERLSVAAAAEDVSGRIDSGRIDSGKGATEHRPEHRTATLAVALRRARVENAEHSAALADLRAAEIVRLELLADALAPVLAQVPEDVDIFDVAIAHGERPRLFLDQIGFVEMDRDRRTYRFLQDTRHGRITLCESADMDEIVDAATNYVAHRLIEREKALAIDYASGGAARIVREAGVEKKPAPSWERAYAAFLFFIEFVGSAAFFGLLAVIAMWAYRTYLPA
ncbi:hypothetical protein WOC76_12245 [Methylocystis sp. IM3]|uniref:hypothetical protein n=1 Tax=unclassified Methylocystis TaxID=2625913 RepID=UPI0030F6DFE4